MAMQTTANYGLKKPGQDDFYNVNIQNENMDVLDETLKDIEENAGTKIIFKDEIPAEPLPREADRLGGHPDSYFATQTDITETQDLVSSKVPTTRKINNKELSADISLTAADVGALSSSAEAKNYGKYSAMSGGSGAVGSHLSFSTEVNDDFNMINLVTYPTRITIPAGVTKIKIHLKNIVVAAAYSDCILTLYKNNAATTEVFKIKPAVPNSDMSEGGIFSWESSILAVASGNYFTVRYEGGGLTPTGLIVEIEVVK